jgi:hypothetical protein
MRLSFLLLFSILSIEHINSFFLPKRTSHHITSSITTSQTQTPTKDHRRSDNHVLSSSSSDNEFIDYIISPPSNDPSFRCTHMIGIPLEQNHDLLLELESVQRAILYHCPLLINACIAPVVTRMPLLLVDTKVNANDMKFQNSSQEEGGKIDMKEMLFNRGNSGLLDNSSPSAPGENDLLTSRDPITRTLHDIVNSVVNDLINVENIKDVNEVGGDGDNASDREGLNNDNIKPLFLKFQGLEIDGESNEILHAIGTESEGTIVLRNVLNEITKRIEERGWRAYVPEDNPQGKNGGLNEDGITWRPRIPFMRLPSDFFETLPSPKGYDGQWQEYTDEQKQNYIRSPEEGGNGISPLFWFKWWDDRLCNGKGVR